MMPIDELKTHLWVLFSRHVIRLLLSVILMFTTVDAVKFWHILYSSGIQTACAFSSTY